MSEPSAPLFDERERAHEKHFGDEQKLHFRALFHAVRETGLWRAKEAGMNDAAANIYVIGLLDLLLAQPNHDVVVERIYDDCVESEISVSKHRLKVMFEDEYEKAKSLIWQGQL